MLLFVVFGSLLLIQGAWSQDSPLFCTGASCTTYKQINTLYCHAHPARFCQCRPSADNDWVLQVMPCPEPETVFSFRHQVCVHPAMRDERDCSILDPLPDPGCEESSCGNYEEINTLTCHSDREWFCQCRPVSTQEDYPHRGLFKPRAMPCAKGTSFSYELQTCAHDGLWIDTCPSSESI